MIPAMCERSGACYATYQNEEDPAPWKGTESYGRSAAVLLLTVTSILDIESRTRLGAGKHLTVLTAASMLVKVSDD